MSSSRIIIQSDKHLALHFLGSLLRTNHGLLSLCFGRPKLFCWVGKPCCPLLCTHFLGSPVAVLCCQRSVLSKLELPDPTARGKSASKGSGRLRSPKRPRPREPWFARRSSPPVTRCQDWFGSSSLFDCCLHTVGFSLPISPLVACLD